MVVLVISGLAYPIIYVTACVTKRYVGHDRIGIVHAHAYYDKWLSFCPFVKAGNLVHLESTVPPGATTNVVCSALQREAGLDWCLDIREAHVQERVLPGNILHESWYDDRIVGGVNAEVTQCAVAFDKNFVKEKVIGADATTAKTVKLIENTFKNVNITLANEFALIMERSGVDVFRAIRLANRHPGVNFFKPGPGLEGIIFQ